jgi:hypothetical protein
MSYALLALFRLALVFGFALKLLKPPHTHHHIKVTPRRTEAGIESREGVEARGRELVIVYIQSAVVVFVAV